MVSADEANKNNKKQKIWWLHLTKFCKEVPSELKILHKKGMYFSIDFGWYSIHFYIVC